MSHHQQAAELMGLVRKHLYIDGKDPKPSDSGRDMNILKGWLDRGVEYDQIADMIRGLGKLRDDGELRWIERGEPMTLRVIASKEARYGRHLSRTAQEYWRQHEAKQYRKGHGMQRAKIKIEFGEAA